MTAGKKQKREKVLVGWLDLTESTVKFYPKTRIIMMLLKTVSSLICPSNVGTNQALKIAVSFIVIAGFFFVVQCIFVF